MSQPVKETLARSYVTGVINVPAPGAGVKASFVQAIGKDPQRRSFVINNSGTTTLFLCGPGTPQGAGADYGFVLLPGAGLVMGHGEAIGVMAKNFETVDGQISFYAEVGEVDS